MFSRLAPRPCLEYIFHLGTCTAVLVPAAMAIAAIAFALQRGIDPVRSHATPTGSEFCRDGWPAVGCPNKSADTSIAKAETGSASQVAAWTENSSVSRTTETDMEPNASSVIPRGYAHTRSRKHAQRRSAYVSIRREKSFTGAGRRFDAVH